jgi:hypothetical protein
MTRAGTTLGIRQLEWIIDENRHLTRTGDETKDDLREAILWLSTHTATDCRSERGGGIQIEDMAFELTRLIPGYLDKASRARNTGMPFTLVDLLGDKYSPLRNKNKANRGGE